MNETNNIIRAKMVSDITELKVLDKGRVQLLDYMGDDESIVEAALVCTGADKTKQEIGDFISTLWRLGHTSPFEQVVFTFCIKSPIFVARQIMRHRTARINELSLRSTESNLEFYMPSDDRLGDHPDTARGYLETLYEQAAGCYKTMLSTHVKKEVARCVLPLSVYTEFFWQMDLHNLLHFFTLRCSLNAQWETRQYANAMKTLAAKVCPLSLKAWEGE